MDKITDLGKIGITLGYEYDDEIIYEKLTIVLYKGKSYISTKTTKGISPEQDNKIWQLIAEAKDAYHMLVDAGKTTLTEKEFLEQLVDATKGRYIVQGNVINAADEEDLTTEHSSLLGIDTLKLADRPSTNGMGYVILRKNKTFAEQITKENTIYEIRYDFNLNGAEITIPEDCVLKFEGGKISNGIIIGNHTIIDSSQNVIFHDIKTNGSWNLNTVYSSWFDCSDDDVFYNITNIATGDKTTTIYIQDKEYQVNANKVGSSYPSAFNVPSNVIIVLNTTISLIGNNQNEYNIFGIYEKENVCIYGNGTIKGDAATHDYSLYPNTEYGNCIMIEGCSNIKISGITVTEAIGDGIRIDISPNLITCSNIYIDNVKSTYNGRQGITIESSDNLTISNCIFNNTGNAPGDRKGIAPMAAIDVEPWRKKDEVLIRSKNIVIHDCIITEQYNGIHIDGGVDNVHVSNIISSGDCAIYDDAKKISISNSTFSDLLTRTSDIVYFDNIKTGCVGIFSVSSARYNNITIDTNIESFYRRYEDNKDVLIRFLSTDIDGKIDIVFSNCVLDASSASFSNDTVKAFNDNTILTITKSIVKLKTTTFVHFDFIDNDIEFLENRSIIANGFSTKETVFRNNICKVAKGEQMLFLSSNSLFGNKFLIANNNIFAGSVDAFFANANSGISGLFVNNFIYNASRDANIRSLEIIRTNTNMDVFGLETRKTGYDLTALPSLGGWDRGSCSFYNGKPVWWTGSKWVDATGADV